MKLSVIIPAYNEEQRIVDTLLDAQDYLEEQNYDFEIIVMVNGSSDQTYEAARSLQEFGMKKISVAQLAKPGKGNAVKHGVLNYADGDIILFMDADNATPVREIKKFFHYFEKGYDVVIGSRYLNPSLMAARPPLYRMILSRASNLLIRLLAVPDILDTQLGFKAFTRRGAADIFSLVTVERWGFDIELLTIAQERGYNIKEVPVIWNEPGGSHITLKAYTESLSDLIKIYRRRLSGKYKTEKIQHPQRAEYKKQSAFT